jgi:uncharacterized membrane protein (UPF0182 family)
VLLLAAVGLIALLLVGPRLVDAYVNWLWFGEVGFRSVWVTVLLTRVAIFVAVALVVGGTVFLALMLAYRSRPLFVPAARPNDPIAPYRTQVMRRSRLFGWGVAVAVGVLCGLIAQSGCSAIRAERAQLVRTRQSGPVFTRRRPSPPPSPTPTEKLIEATMCPPPF